jgi:hypothetical protein
MPRTIQHCHLEAEAKASINAVNISWQMCAFWLKILGETDNLIQHQTFVSLSLLGALEKPIDFYL